MARSQDPHQRSCAPAVLVYERPHHNGHSIARLFLAHQEVALLLHPPADGGLCLRHQGGVDERYFHGCGIVLWLWSLFRHHEARLHRCALEVEICDSTVGSDSDGDADLYSKRPKTDLVI